MLKLVADHNFSIQFRYLWNYKNLRELSVKTPLYSNILAIYTDIVFCKEKVHKFAMKST